jgi:hypothetical protein
VETGIQSDDENEDGIKPNHSREKEEKGQST